MKKFLLSISACLLFVSVFAQLKVETDGAVTVNTNAKMHMTATGTLSGASGFDFNTGTTTKGFLLEQYVGESSGFYCDGDFAVIYSPGDQSRLLRVYDEDGMVEKWYLDANGNAYTISDERSKMNIMDINNCLAQLNSLKAKKYNYIGNDEEKKDKSGENKFDSSKKEYYGFLAQDVEKVFPNVVSEDEKGNKFVSYTQLIPVIVEGMNEQQNVINAQQDEIDQLKAQLNELAEKVKTLLSGN